MTNAVSEVEAAVELYRDSGRAAMGVTGTEERVPFWATLRRHRLGLYPITALGLLVIVDGFQLTAVIIMGPEISRALGLGKTAIGGLILLNQLALMCASLPMAALVERRPRRALVAKVTGIGWSIVTLFTAFVITPIQMAAVMVLDGGSSGSTKAVHWPLLADSYPPVVRVRVLSAHRGFLAVGAIAAPALVALLTGPLELTWRGTLLVLGALCLLVSLVALRLRDPGFGTFDTARLRGEVRGASAEHGTTLAADEFAPGTFEILRRLLLMPTFRRSVLAGTVLGMLIVPLFTYFTFFLEERWGLSPDQRALFFTLVPIFTIAALVAFARVGDRLRSVGPQRLYAISSVLVVLGVGSFGLSIIAPALWLVVICFGVGYAGLTILEPVASAALFAIVRPEMRPHASAIFSILQYGAGGIGGLLLLGGADARYGITGALAAILIPGFGAAFLLLGCTRTAGADLDRMVDELVEEEELRELTTAGVHLPLLSCKHVDFAYGQLQVLFDVGFTVDDGEMVALLGTNGAGKSTLLRVISGLGIPSRGSVRFRGGDITYLDAERRVRLGITQVPGGRAVFGPLTVVENLETFAYTHGGDRRAVSRGVDESFAAFPRLSERRNSLAATLSGGEQQMLGLSKALILRPRLLLIDELSLGLAPRVVEELLGMVRRINERGAAVVLVEQSVNVALELVEHAYFMEKGEIRFDGRAEDLIGRDDLLRSVFLEGAARGLEGNGRVAPAASGVGG